MAETYRRQREAQGTGHRVVVVSEPDRGLYDAMNKGLARATGDYLVFLNAGDAYPAADTLERIARVAEAGGRPAVLYGDTDIVDDGGRFLRHRRLAPPKRLTWRSFCRGMQVCHQAFYVDVAVARHVPYQLRYRYSADVDWCIRVMKETQRQGRPLVRVPGVVVNYLDGGLTTAHHRDSLRERFRVMRSHYGLPLTVVMHAWFLVRSLWK